MSSRPVELWLKSQLRPIPVSGLAVQAQGARARSREGDPVAGFASCAVDFCALVERCIAMDRQAFLHAVHQQLAPLYAAALALPLTENAEHREDAGSDDLQAAVASFVSGAQDERLGSGRWMRIYQSLSALIGDRALYSQVFDPYGPATKAPVTCSLADDVADIYRDLADGLALWHRGQVNAALAHWRGTFTRHWGGHVLGALRALHAQAGA